MNESNETNPQIEAVFNDLAMICCDAIGGEQDSGVQRTDALLKTLLMSGYVWKNNSSFQSELEARVKDRCRDAVMNRGGELSALSGKLAKKFEVLARWESNTPSDDSPPAKAANISSATDA